MRTTVALFLLAASAWAQNATTPGAVMTPFPTIENLAVEWAIAGDADLDGVVTVRYRALGTMTWSVGLPLRRVPAGSNAGFSWTNKHSGSVFGLAPATTYEIELTLNDPDGGSTVVTTSAATRAVPVAASGAPVVAVTPSTFSAAATAANPGDILQLAPGIYSGFVFTRNGTVSQPIVIRSETAGGAVINGDVRFDNRSYVFLEKATVNGMVKFNAATGIVVRGCTINAPSTGGVIAYTPNGTTPGATNCTSRTTSFWGRIRGRTRIWAPTERLPRKASR